MVTVQKNANIAMFVARVARAALTIALLATASILNAQQSTIVIGNDRGGLLGARASEIAGILGVGSRVEIRGAICYSSCTMYLGAGNVCVIPNTAFGFHGPSDYGRPLSSERFEHWSQVMAGHYREPLRSWFMSSARYQRVRVVTLSGAQLIDMGYSRC